MTPLELLQQKQDDILQIAARHGAHNIRVFGSVARGVKHPFYEDNFLRLF